MQQDEYLRRLLHSKWDANTGESVKWTDENAPHGENFWNTEKQSVHIGHILLLIGILAAFLIGIILLSEKAKADPPQGTDPNSPTHIWFEGRYSVAGKHCCGWGDGHTVADKDWRLNPDCILHPNLATSEVIQGCYQVRIHDQWHDITPDMWADPTGKPDSIGDVAVVWYRDIYDEGGASTLIYCFAPGLTY